MDKVIYGADTETVKGKPNSLQFYSEDVPCERIEFVDERNSARKFIEWCNTRKPRVLHVVYMHMLSFDIIELFWGKYENLIQNGGEFDFNAYGWHVRGLYGTPTFASLSRGHDRRIVLVDSYSFYRGSLASAAQLFCPDLPKLPRPRGIGERRYTAKDTSFVEYAMRDAVVAYHIGRQVEELHREFDLQQCISIADMASRIFRHCFLTYNIPQPSDDVIAAALDSYHGGKNNLTAKPGWHTGITGIDISSAYPHAMHQLPAFSNGNLYKRYRALRGARLSSVPSYGVYRVAGTLRDCRWPVLFGHDFKPLRGDIEGVWIQGIELNEALRSGEFHATKISGFYYDAERDNQAPALRKFCEDFYDRKQSEKDKVRRHGYKTILNSLYGKFIQTRKRSRKYYHDIDSSEGTDASELVAGGLFHPFIASAITADTRARIHRIEHHYKALHTATDGIFTYAKPERTGMYRVQKGAADELGQLTTEVEGNLLLLRCKCYIVYADTGEIESRAFQGKRIAKYALHGFQGGVFELERLMATGERKYKASRPNRLKESLKRGLTPNEFVERDYVLKIGPVKVHENEK
jgi:hypothetical protein